MTEASLDIYHQLLYFFHRIIKYSDVNVSVLRFILPCNTAHSVNRFVLIVKCTLKKGKVKVFFMLKMHTSQSMNSGADGNSSVSIYTVHTALLSTGKFTHQESSIQV